MKLILLLLGLMSLLFSCSPEPDITIQFCESLDQNDQCSVDRNQFKLGEKVFVRCESEAPFVARKIIGKIYRLEKDRQIPLSSKEFNLTPGNTYITQNIPFHEFGYEALGNFLVEFVDDKNQLLAKREITITDS